MLHVYSSVSVLDVIFSSYLLFVDSLYYSHTRDHTECKMQMNMHMPYIPRHRYIQNRSYAHECIGLSMCMPAKNTITEEEKEKKKSPHSFVRHFHYTLSLSFADPATWTNACEVKATFPNRGPHICK